MLSRALDLLDQHLYGNLSRAADKEALEGITQVYKQLSFRPEPVNYYQGNQLEGIIEPLGDVGFKRKYPELGIKSYRSPEELMQLIQNEPHDYYEAFGNSNNLNRSETLNILNNYANQPKPTRELLKINQAFQDYSNSEDGSRLYSNFPISSHRAKAYERIGFESMPNKIMQVLDRRPGYSDLDMNKLYAFGDTQQYSPGVAQALINQRAARANQPTLALPLSEIIPTKYLNRSQPIEYTDNYDDISF